MEERILKFKYYLWEDCIFVAEYEAYNGNLIKVIGSDKFVKKFGSVAEAKRGLEKIRQAGSEVEDGKDTT